MAIGFSSSVATRRRIREANSDRSETEDISYISASKSESDDKKVELDDEKKRESEADREKRRKEYLYEEMQNRDVMPDIDAYPFYTVHYHKDISEDERKEYEKNKAERIKREGEDKRGWPVFYDEKLWGAMKYAGWHMACLSGYGDHNGVTYLCFSDISKVPQEYRDVCEAAMKFAKHPRYTFKLYDEKFDSDTFFDESYDHCSFNTQRDLLREIKDDGSNLGEVGHKIYKIYREQYKSEIYRDPHRLAVMKAAMFWRFHGFSDDTAIRAAELCAKEKYEKCATITDIESPSFLQKMCMNFRKEQYREFYMRDCGYEYYSKEEQLKRHEYLRSIGRPYPDESERGILTLDEWRGRNITWEKESLREKKGQELNTMLANIECGDEDVSAEL